MKSITFKLGKPVVLRQFLAEQVDEVLLSHNLGKGLVRMEADGQSFEMSFHLTTLCRQFGETVAHFQQNQLSTILSDSESSNGVALLKMGSVVTLIPNTIWVERAFKHNLLESALIPVGCEKALTTEGDLFEANQESIKIGFATAVPWLYYEADELALLVQKFRLTLKTELEKLHPQLEEVSWFEDYLQGNSIPESLRI